MKKLLILLLGLVIVLSGCGPKVENEETKKLNQIIDRFIEVYAGDYIKLGDNPVLNEYVIVGIKALEENGKDISLNDYLTNNQVKDYFDELKINSVSNAYVNVIISNAFGVAHDKANIYLESLTEDDIDAWSYNFGLMALRIADVNVELQNQLLAKINVIREEDYRDADYAGVALVATSGKTIDKEDLYKLINENLTESGVEFWGNASAASTATVILGLIADGKNPTDEQYATNGVNLVDALLEYHLDGAFKNNLTDESADLLFATPQAFCALVSYKLYLEGKSANILLP